MPYRMYFSARTDHRASHLQPAAHTAVSRVLKAHHDSSFPDRWLDVWWLCGKHHKLWHDRNEPEWPTIFDFHPSDQESRRNPGRRGKHPRPWWHSSRKAWFVGIGGRQRNLGPDHQTAVATFERLLAEHHAERDAKSAVNSTG